MQTISDYQGREIRLTDERLAHVLEHPELVGLESGHEETLSAPHQVVESRGDPQVNLYYRRYPRTRVGDKYLCVVVKLTQEDAFVITAYLTDKIKRGIAIWPRKS